MEAEIGEMLEKGASYSYNVPVGLTSAQLMLTQSKVEKQGGIIMQL